MREHTGHDDSGDEVSRLKDRVRDLEAALKQNDNNVATTFKLSHQMSNLMGLLLALPHVTPEMIRQRLEVSSDAKVAKHRLQKSIAAWDVKIHTRRGLGYWIKDEDKAKLTALLESPKALATEVPQQAAPVAVTIPRQIDLEEAIAAKVAAEVDVIAAQESLEEKSLDAALAGLDLPEVIAA